MILKAASLFLCSDILRQQEISPSNDAFKIILGNRIDRKVWSLKHSIHEMFEFYLQGGN